MTHSGVWTLNQQLRAKTSGRWVAMGGPYAGGVANTDYVTVTNAPTTNGTSSISLGVSGYKGTLHIYLCGTSSLTGHSYDSGPAWNGTGEMAKWTYTCLGTETSFSLTQENLNSTDTSTTIAQLKFIVNGSGANDGQYLVVGSARGNTTSYGHGGACQNRSAAGTLNATRVAYGANRYYSTQLGYSDDTYYGPDSYASYGEASSAYYQIGSDASALQMCFQSGLGYGLQYRATSGSAYSSYSYLTRSGLYSNSRYPTIGANTGFGVCILVYKNDV